MTSPYHHDHLQIIGAPATAPAVVARRGAAGHGAPDEPERARVPVPSHDGAWAISGGAREHTGRTWGYWPRTAVILAVAVLGVTATAAAAAAPQAQPASGGVRLGSFASCDALLSYSRTRALALVGPWGLGGYQSTRLLPLSVSDGATEERPSVPLRSAKASAGDGIRSPGVDYSGTNVQEAGVDEPDLTKTDGRRMFTVVDGDEGDVLHALDVTGGTARRTGRLALPDELSGAQLLLAGDRLLVISEGVSPSAAAVSTKVGSSGTAGRTDVTPSPLVPPVRATVLTLVDVADPGAMRVVETLRLEGTFVSARLVDAAVRVVTSAAPEALPLVGPSDLTSHARKQARDANVATVRRSRLRTWLPSFALTRGRRTVQRGQLVPCDEVRRAPRFSGLGMLTVTTIDLGRGLGPVDADSIQTDGEVVYASGTALYVTTPKWIDPALEGLPAASSGATTEIHLFDTSSPTETTYRGSGSVRGFVLNQFSLSEHEGILRVATTDTPPWWDEEETARSQSFVTTLRPEAAGLVQVGRVGGLGRGERIYAVRFLGSVGYVVTFREVDPLYTVDLSDPVAPRVRGELKIPGFSAYLHPVGEGLLLGVGQNATDEGEVLGTQVSLFDVSNLDTPRRLQHTTFRDAWSEAEEDHHAFLFWAPTGLAVIPVSNETADFEPFTSAAGMLVGRDTGITRIRRITHPFNEGDPDDIRRSAVVGDALYTVSSGGVKVSDLSSLVERTYVPLP
jgi:uncharacterized secreted protein with C-terminal beta-propeller domain